MADFPAILPKPLLSSFQGRVGTTVQRTDFDSGPARQRRKFTDAPDALQLSWRLDATQMTAFRDFYKTTLHDGTDWFNLALNIGNGLQNYEARFTGAYEYQYLRPIWNISASVEVRVP